MITRIGFTGSRNSLPDAQKATLKEVLASLHRLGANTFHHGDCVGADRTAHNAVRALGMHTESHPPKSDRYRAFCAVVVTHPPKPYLVRNRDIVKACDVLVGCPKGPETQRSGTWATIRYARQDKRKIILIWPDGSFTGDVVRS